MKNPDSYSCNANPDDDSLKASEVTTYTVIEEKDGEEAIYRRATLCDTDADRLVSNLDDSLGFVSVTKQEALNS